MKRRRYLTTGDKYKSPAIADCVKTQPAKAKKQMPRLVGAFVFLRCSGKKGLSAHQCHQLTRSQHLD
ncbi:hypothetical protein ACN1C3_29270, partial [Pseudomonas sp. H11T01]|uniref:hypothetical protein n=1 Tax=Pseudomonas sp. H11T01 TaxID=3402749 RepID=UPI003ACF419C